MMIYLQFGLLAISLFQQENPLKSLQWEKRIILLYATRPTDEVYQNQLTLFLNGQPEQNDRDLVIFSVFEKEGKAHDLQLPAGWPSAVRNRYFSSPKPFELLLIGKDGGVKMRKTHLINEREVFALIDQMPMRRAEMKKK